MQNLATIVGKKQESRKTLHRKKDYLRKFTKDEAKSHLTH